MRRPDLRVGRKISSPAVAALGVAATVLAALTMLPLGALVVTAFGAGGGALAHAAATVLPGYLATTLVLVVAVAVTATTTGVTAAWLVTMCRFPGRRVLSVALVLPLAMPAYVAAYAYTDLLQHPGPVQTALRAVTGWGPQEYWFPRIRSLPGAAFVLAMVLYPYVYLLARTAFLQQSASAFEAARTLGQGPWRAFATVAVPLARPAIVGGVALAAMETLADYGTVQYFGVNTFTVAIYRAWFAFGDRAAAVQLALALVGVVLLVLALERLGRRGRRFALSSARPMPLLALSGWRAGLAATACTLPVLFGFAIPAATLAWRAATNGAAWFDPRTLTLIDNTLTLAGVGGLASVTVALVVAYARRLGTGSPLASRLAGFGYAVPGAVIAVGLLIPFALFDRWLHAAMVATFGIRTGLLLTGTIAAVVFAYVVRFLVVSLNAVEAGLARIPPSLDGAARTLGAGPGRTFARVHVPLLSGTLLTAFLITVVDIMKELPATLILRPFNFDTLAIRAHRLASDERLAEAAVPSLMIVAASLLPVLLLSRQIARSQVRGAAEAAAVLTPADVAGRLAAAPKPEEAPTRVGREHHNVAAVTVRSGA